MLYPNIHFTVPSLRHVVLICIDTQSFWRIAPCALQIPINYIGRLETVEDDWEELIEIANSREGVAQMDFAPLVVVRRHERANGPEKVGNGGGLNVCEDVDMLALCCFALCCVVRCIPADWDSIKRNSPSCSA